MILAPLGFPRFHPCPSNKATTLRKEPILHLPYPNPITISTMSSPSSSSSNPPTPPEPSTMPSYSRAEGRNVHIFNANDPDTVLGGLILTNGVTNANLYAMVEIIVIVTSEYFLRNEGNIKIEKDDHPLQPGKYDIVAASKFLHNCSFICR